MTDSSGRPADDPLAALAAAYGVATSYRSAGGTHVPVPANTVRRVLAALRVDASDPAAALADAQSRRWSRLAAPTVVVRSGPGAAVLVRAPADVAVHARIAFEEGGQAEARRTGAPVAERGTGPARRWAVPLQLPADLPHGYHRMVVSAGDEGAEVLLAVTPDRLEQPAGSGRAWGWMAQLYALRSAGSWGMGDYADLATLVADAGSRGAELVLVNPLHACAPTHPVENSPYYPASRRFSSPLYLRPERLAEYAVADARTRAGVDELGRTVPRAELLDRDAVWTAKRAALEALFGFRVERAGAEHSTGLRDFATWCALAERHGPDWREWPPTLHDPRGPAVASARAQLAGRVAFHEWLQHCCADQLADAQLVAVDAGMEIGIVHDIAVGVHPGGADAWALQDDLATDVSVGAPPDDFNQLGQDWRVPPWRPDRLPETGYAPVRDMVRAVLAHGGGLRLDHVMGLWRLWWVPAGLSPVEGTYVGYDGDAMLGIVALEAERAGGLLVGEDLGTVEPAVQDALAERGVLGSAVLWFERDESGGAARQGAGAGEQTPVFRPPAAWRANVVASVTTHDLPTARGYLVGEHVRVRGELGVLGRPLAEETAAWQRELDALRALIEQAGLIEPGFPFDEGHLADVALALHALLCRSPAKIVLAGLADAVGDLRQPNMPGTVDEYPNWRLPVADETGRSLTLERILAHPGLDALTRQLLSELAATSRGPGSGAARSLP
ncbi:MAG: 4-alpha-glucanotransferase [Frankiaceae bacterium]